MRTYILASGIGVMSVIAYSQQPNPAPTAQLVVPKQQTVAEIPKVTTEKTMSFWMAKKLAHTGGSSIAEINGALEEDKERDAKW